MRRFPEECRVGVGERLIRFRVVLVQVSSRGRCTRRSRGCASLRCCSVELMPSPDAGALELGTADQPETGRGALGTETATGLPRLFTSPRLTGNCKHALQRPERGLATRTQRNGKRPDEERRASRLPAPASTRTTSRAGSYCSKHLSTASELPAAGHSTMQTYTRSLRETRLKNTPRQKCRASVLTLWRDRLERFSPVKVLSK